VLKVAGLPEPSQNKPDDTIPFLFSEKVWNIVIASESEAISRGFSNKTAARRLHLAGKRGLYERKKD